MRSSRTMGTGPQARLIRGANSVVFLKTGGVWGVAANSVCRRHHIVTDSFRSHRAFRRPCHRSHSAVPLYSRVPRRGKPHHKSPGGVRAGGGELACARKAQRPILSGAILALAQCHRVMNHLLGHWHENGWNSCVDISGTLVTGVFHFRCHDGDSMRKRCVAPFGETWRALRVRISPEVEQDKNVSRRKGKS